MNTPNRLSLIGYYVSFICLGLTSASLGPTLTGLRVQTGTTLSEISLLLAVRPFGYLLGSLLAGRLYDRLRGHPLIAGAVALMAFHMALVPALSLFWVLVAATLIIGVAEATIDVGTNTLIVWTYGERVGPYMNGLHFMFGVGAFIAPLVVAQALAWSGGIAWAYWVLAGLILPAAALMLRAPSPAVRAGPESAEAGGGRLNYLLIGLLVFFFFLYAGSEVAFGAWVYTYASSLGLADPTMAAYLNSAFWGALTLGRFLSIPFAHRFRPRTILGVSLLGSLVSIGLPLFWPQSPALIWVGAIGAGLAMAPIFPITLTLAGRRIPLTGQITSFFFVGASLGGMAIPWLIGQLFERAGPPVTMLTIFIDLIAGCAVFALLMWVAPAPARPSRGER